MTGSARGDGSSGSGRHAEHGQSTVEAALAVPVVVLLVLVVLQVAIVGRDAVLIHHVAREEARRVAVGEPGSGSDQWPALDPDRLAIRTTGGGGPGRVAIVRIDYRSPTDVPIVGTLIGDVPLSATVGIRLE